MMDYQIYMDIFEEDDKNYNYSLNSHFFDCRQEDVTGLHELVDKSDEDILRILINRKDELDNCYEELILNSTLNDIFPRRQMIKDFWLDSFVKMADMSFLSQEEKIELVQFLMELFDVDNCISAREYYNNMDVNEDFAIYIQHCFGTKGEKCVLFWHLLSCIDYNDDNISSVIFTKEYIKFMMQLEVYLDKKRPKSGFGGEMKAYIMRLLKVTSNEINVAVSIGNPDYIFNPLVEDM